MGHLPSPRAAVVHLAASQRQVQLSLERIRERPCARRTLNDAVVLPYSQLLPWLAEHGPSVRLLFVQLFLGHVSAFFGLEALISALVLLVFIFSEGTRHKIGMLWLPLAATCLIGVSCGLPLFLYLREHQAERST